MIPNTHYLGFCQIHNYDDKRLTTIPTHNGKIYSHRRNRNGKKNQRTDTNEIIRSFNILDRSFKSFVLCNQS